MTGRPRFPVAACKHTGADPCERRACRYSLPRGLGGERCSLAIIEARHGDGLTLREIGTAFGVSHERVRQIEALALVRLARRVAAATADPRPETRQGQRDMVGADVLPMFEKLLAKKKAADMKARQRDAGGKVKPKPIEAVPPQLAKPAPKARDMAAAAVGGSARGIQRAKELVRAVAACHLPAPAREPRENRGVEPCHFPPDFHPGRERVG